jgi:hypothetical protein
VVGAGNIFNGITKAKAKAPSFNNFDGYVGVILAAVVFGVVDGFFGHWFAY